MQNTVSRGFHAEPAFAWVEIQAVVDHKSPMTHLGGAWWLGGATNLVFGRQDARVVVHCGDELGLLALEGHSADCSTRHLESNSITAMDADV